MLNDEVQAFYTRVYGSGDLTRLEAAQFRAPHGTYLIGATTPGRGASRSH